MVRLALMALGVGLSVSVLLGGLAFDHAAQARNARIVDQFQGGLMAGPGTPRDSTLIWSSVTTFGRQVVQLTGLHGTPISPVPLGLARMPATGEAFVSPGLLALIDGPDGALLATGLGGKVVGTVSPAGLVEPSELIAYVGLPLGKLPLEKAVVYRPPSGAQPVSLFRGAALVLLGLALLAFLFPVGLFVVTATRLSTATREVKLAAIRLAGASAGQVRWILAIEAALAALVGDVFGLALFLGGRATALQVPSVARTWFPSDLTTPLADTALVLAVVPLLVLLVALVGSRRIVVGPLGLVRRTQRTRSGAVWIGVGVAGVSLLALAAWQRTWVMRQTSPIPGVIMGLAGVGILVGLVGGAGWVSWWIARAVARRTRGRAMLLGARRLEADPGSATRIVASVAVLVALAGIGQAVILADVRDTGAIGAYEAPWARSLAPNTVIANASRGPAPAALRSLATVPGVRSVRLTRHYLDGGTNEVPSTAVISTFGGSATLQRIRNRLMWNGSASTLGDLRAQISSGANGELRFTGWVEAIGLVLLLVTGATLLISTVDAMMERRRALAMLTALGADRALLRRSILVQVGIPLGVATVLGVGASLLVTTLLFALLREPLLLPLARLATIAGVATCLVLGVTLAAMPWDRLVRRQELLHGE